MATRTFLGILASNFSDVSGGILFLSIRALKQYTPINQLKEVSNAVLPVF
jgi:hypothetical protein